MGISGVPGLGARGEFPEGKLDASDEGQLRLAVAADVEHKLVLVDFGKPVKWFGLTKAEAINFANMIRDKARQLPE